jgi:hypothetical protein
MEMVFTTACDENGYLTAMKAELLTDSGAYASLGGPCCSGPVPRRGAV